MIESDLTNIENIHPFNRITFSIPIETFKIDAFVTDDKREPVVTEFSLRLLWISGPIPINTFQSFFGFSDSESISLIDSLKNKGLIELFEEKIQLSNYSISAFQSSNQEYPSFVKIEQRSENITFDLISMSPIPYPKNHSPQNSISLNISTDIQGRSVELAKDAYYKKFDQILKITNQSHKKTMAYAINDIESKRRNLLHIPVALYLDNISGKIERFIDPYTEKDLPNDLIEHFNERISEELGGDVKVSGIEELESFINIFDCSFLYDYVIDNRFDFKKYIYDIENNLIKKSSVLPIYGALYIPRNLEKVINRIRLRRSPTKDTQNLTSFIWIAPDYEFWGRGDLLENSFSALNSALKENENNNAFLLTRCSGNNIQLVSNRFRSSKISELHLYQPVSVEGTALLENLELALYPNGFMSAILHLSSNENKNIKIPIGFISRQPKHLKYAHTFIESIINSNRYMGKQSFNNRNALDFNDPLEIFSFLKRNENLSNLDDE